MAKKTRTIYQIKVTLLDTHPPIWRRIQAPSNTTLLKLHDILQIVMGWMDSHCHQFNIDGFIYGDPANDEYGDLGTYNEAKYKLNRFIYGKGQRFSYEYDFGDRWKHTLLVEKVLPCEEGVHYPRCVKGKGACPPEDVGGVWGYQHFLQAMGDPNHLEHSEYIEWIGGKFVPEAFDLEKINADLFGMGRGRSRELYSVWSPGEMHLADRLSSSASSWIHQLSRNQLTIAENLTLRRDVIALLTYLRDNSVTGAQSTGNLPLKAVREICAKFVHPPKMEESIGNRIFRVRSETEVWPLLFRHVLASAGGLATGGMGRRWRLTSLGEKFLTAPASIQVWMLLITWWTQINWAIAFPFNYEKGYFPDNFPRLTLKHLLYLSPGKSTSFEPFADCLIDDVGLVWPIEDQEFAQEILRSMVERTVIDPLVDFGVLEVKYTAHKTLEEKHRELSDIRITSIGMGLLAAMNVAIKRIES